MFVQVIKGKTNDIEGMKRQGQKWADEVRPGAIGFVGGTSGITDDGAFIVIARFEDEASARKNETRPEQAAWMQEAQKYFVSPPTFRESTDTALLFDGGSDTAGFVQVMESTVADRAKAEAFETDEMLEQLRAARPDLIGGLRVWFADNTCVEVAYFTSEAEARKAEGSSEFGDQQSEFAALYSDTTYYDLKDPQYS